MAASINNEEKALVLARTIAQLAQVNSAMDKLFPTTRNVECQAFLPLDNDVDSMLANARDDLRLGGVLFDTVEAAEAGTTTVRPVMRSMGIAKRPRQLNSSQTDYRPLRDAKMLKAAHVLRCALQKRFPLTWDKLLEEEKK